MQFGLILFVVDCLAPPPPPNSLCVTKETTSTVTLEWPPPEEDGGAAITAFVIDMRGPLDSEFHTLCKVDGDLYTCTAAKLNAGSEYDFLIKAENEAGLSPHGTKLKTPARTRAKASEFEGINIFSNKILCI